jgi:hypothetical protein
MEIRNRYGREVTKKKIKEQEEKAKWNKMKEQGEKREEGENEKKQK